MFILACLLVLQNPLAVQSTDFPKALQDRAVAATVYIGNPAQKSEGSGVIVGKKDKTLYVLTAYHVVQDSAGRLEVTVFSQNPAAEITYRFAQVVAKVPGIRDLALVQVVADKPAPEILPIFPLAQAGLQDRMPALSSGCARGLPPTGMVIEAVEKKQVQRPGEGTALFWQAPEKGTKGRSGGPLIDSQGFVVGICSGTSAGKSYYTHIDEIHRFLKQDGFSWLAEKK